MKRYEFLKTIEEQIDKLKNARTTKEHYTIVTEILNILLSWNHSEESEQFYALALQDILHYLNLFSAQHSQGILITSKVDPLSKAYQKILECFELCYPIKDYPEINS